MGAYRGRYFNEATLPSAPDWIKLFSLHRKPPQPKTTQPEAIERKDIAQSSAEETNGSIPINEDRPVDDALPQPANAGPRRPTSQGHADPVRSQTGAAVAEERDGAREGKKGQDQDADQMDVDQRDRLQVSEQARIETVVESPSGSPGVDPALTKAPSLDAPDKAVAPQKEKPPDVAPSPYASSLAADTMQAKRRDGISTPTKLIPPPADLASSPASTNGLDSASTPRPPAVSPDTSPGDEDPPLSKQGPDPREGALEEDKDAVQDIPRPKEPSTPSKIGPPEVARDVGTENNTPTESSTPVIASPVVSGPAISKPPPPRRPNMRIDTVSAGHSGFVESPAEITGRMTTAFTPKRPAPPSSTVHSPPERMTTRVSSGAIRHKSVSEILGETPKPISPQNEKGSSDSSRAGSTSEGMIPGSGRETPSYATAQRQLDRRERDKERSRLSTVVFPKQQAPIEPADTIEVLRKVSDDHIFNRQQRDYLYSLFVAKANSAPRGPSLGQLLASANKSLSTSDYMVEQKEQKSVRTLKRIYQLQNANRWPLRQMDRSAEPPRPTSQWDFVMDHARWMRTDFREERRWKIAAARGVAEWCAEFIAGDGAKRKSLQVQIRPPKFLKDHESADLDTKHAMNPESSPKQSTPDLIPAAEDDSISEGFAEDPRDISLSQTPAAIFSLSSTEFNFCYSRTAAADKLLEELPLYQPTKAEPELAQSDLAERRDAKWRKNIVPISKYATTKVRLVPSTPPRKRSRYSYSPERDSHEPSEPFKPEQTDVALFMPENKHIRDRIHPGHSFRPPTEHPMPTQGFYESRMSSQWTGAEDDELRKLVRDYSYNWSLISSCLAPKTTYHSGADRRTPWECFERWIGLEGLPADMSKTPYFKAYHARIEAAQKTVAAQQQAAQQQAGGGQMSVRRRTTLPLRVDRKRNSKHLALVDAFRKLAKKREVAAQKQQHAAGLAAMRKANEANQPKPPIQTPQQFSRLKHDREQKMAERQELYRQQMLAQQKAAAQQRSGQLGVPNGNSANLRAGNVMNGALPAAPSLANVPNGQFPQGSTNQARAMPGAQALPNGQQVNSAMAANAAANIKNLAQAQAQGNMVGNRAQMGSPENLRMFMEATRLQQEQQRYVHQRQIAQQQGQQNPPGQPGSQTSPKPSMAMMNGASANTPNLMAAMQANGNLSPAVSNGSQTNGGTPVGSSTSPRLPTAGQQLSSGMMPQISQLMARIAAQQPDLSTEEIQRRATQQLARNSQQQRSMNQAALNAAAGAVNAGHSAHFTATYGNSGMGNSMQQQQQQQQQQGGMMTNEQVQRYSQTLKQQAVAQRNAAAAAAALGNGGSPNMAMARPGSRHSQGQESHPSVSAAASPQLQRVGSQGQHVPQLIGNGQGAGQVPSQSQSQSKSPDMSAQQQQQQQQQQQMAT
ncbi:MAG: hypothetical protein Q9160_007778 [Pyrenula sp. 1 TL-2023]